MTKWRVIFYARAFLSFRTWGLSPSFSVGHGFQVGEPTCLLVESEQVHTDQPQAVAQDVPHVPHLRRPQLQPTHLQTLRALKYVKLIETR